MSKPKLDALDFSSKKKKKPKTPAAAVVVEPTVSDLPDFGVKKPKAKPILPEAVRDEAAEPELLLEFSSKKKKAPKTAIPVEATENDDPNGTSLADSAKKKTSKTVTIVDGAVDKAAEELADLAFTRKKKKARKALDETSSFAPTGGDESADEAEVEVAPRSTYGYSYETLLARVFAQIQANNPDLITDQKRRLVMAPPCMARVGTKKTQFTNFSAICRSLNRKADHLSAYMFAELGTTGSLDANGALLIKGKYLSKHIEPVLRNYARTYVLCSTCQSPDTDLSRDSRLLFLQCRRCGSRVTVKNVTSGFQAVTGKRAAIRAKAQ